MRRTILSISLSDSGLAVGLDRGGREAIVDTLVRPATDQHSDILIPAINELLTSSRCTVADLTGVAFDAGPGGFTRIRVACAVAQGLAFSRAIPVMPIDSLAATALAVCGDSRVHGPVSVLVAMDARMGECYVGRYRVHGGAVTELTESQLVPADGLADWLAAPPDDALSDAGADGSAGETVLLAGDALERYPGVGTGCAGKDAGMPRAGALIQAVMCLARQSTAWVDAADAAPRYVRNKVALNVSEQAARRGGR